MKPAPLQRTDVAQGEKQPSLCGGSLSSNYVPLNLENKILAQPSTLMPQSCSHSLNLAAQPSSSPFLQPSSLSSTSSSLLCTSSCSSAFTSPLLSTENTLLCRPSVLTASSCLTSVATGYLVTTSLSSTGLLGQSAHDEDGEESSQVTQSCLGETSTVNKTILFFNHGFWFILINALTLFMSIPTLKKANGQAAF